MSVYNPQGGGNVHVDRVISGGRVAKKAAKKAAPLPPFMTKGTKKAVAKKVPAKKTAAKKVPPQFMAERAQDLVTGGKGSSKPMAGKPIKQASASQRKQTAMMAARAGKTNMARGSGGGSSAAC